VGYALLQIFFLLIGVTIMFNFGDIELENNWYDFFLKDDSISADEIEIDNSHN
jgi:hypothetical protein